MSHSKADPQNISTWRITAHRYKCSKYRKIIGLFQLAVRRAKSRF
jgi:hypothetical protein